MAADLAMLALCAIAVVAVFLVSMRVDDRTPDDTEAAVANEEPPAESVESAEKWDEDSVEGFGIDRIPQQRSAEQQVSAGDASRRDDEERV